MQCQCQVAKFGSVHTRDAYIDRHRLHVQTVPRHPVGVGPKVLIAPRCSVTTHDFDFGVSPSAGKSQIMKQVEHARIVLVNIAGPVIA